MCFIQPGTFSSSISDTGGMWKRSHSESLVVTQTQALLSAGLLVTSTGTEKMLFLLFPDLICQTDVQVHKNKSRFLRSFHLKNKIDSFRLNSWSWLMFSSR